MDPSPPRKELRLQGPRPSALKIRDDSHKIKKPPPHKPPQHHQKPAAGAGHDDNNNQRRQPVIIYSVSPKVIYADESEFRSVVQRLTGPSSTSTSTSTSAAGAEFHSSFQPSSSGNISPAARLATVEKTRSPREADRDRGVGGLERNEELTSDVMAEGVEMSQIPGILSPAPANLPQISSNFFSSSAIESPSQWGALGHDFSPNYRYGFSNPGVGFTTPSPSGLFSAPIMSPTLSYDLFNHFMDQ